MLLPARRLHDRYDCCPLGLFEQVEDSFLLGTAPVRTRGNLCRLCRLLRVFSWRDLRLVGRVAVRHSLIPSVATAKAPSPPKPRTGDEAGGAGAREGHRCPQRAGTVTLCWP